MPPRSALASAAALLLAAAAAQPISTHSSTTECSMDYDGCLDSKCCVNPGFDCYKRPTVEYAQCRPVDLACADNNQWLCPGWESCAAHMGDCTGSHCCSNVNDKCYQKQTHYFQCKPSCDASDPGWDCTVHTPPSTCSSAWGDCTSSRCCAQGAAGWNEMNPAAKAAKAKMDDDEEEGLARAKDDDPHNMDL